MSEQVMAIHDRLSAKIIKGALAKLQEHCIFPEVAGRIIEAVRQRLRDGVYEARMLPMRDSNRLKSNEGASCSG